MAIAAIASTRAVWEAVTEVDAARYPIDVRCRCGRPMRHWQERCNTCDLEQYQRPPFVEPEPVPLAVVLPPARFARDAARAAVRQQVIGGLLPAIRPQPKTRLRQRPTFRTTLLRDQNNGQNEPGHSQSEGAKHRDRFALEQKPKEQQSRPDRPRFATPRCRRTRPVIARTPPPARLPHACGRGRSRGRRPAGRCRGAS